MVDVWPRKYVRRGIWCSVAVKRNSDILHTTNEKFVTASESVNATFYCNKLCKSSKKCFVETCSVVDLQQEVTAETAIVMLQTTTNNLLEQLLETQKRQTEQWERLANAMEYFINKKIEKL